MFHENLLPLQMKKAFAKRVFQEVIVPGGKSITISTVELNCNIWNTTEYMVCQIYHGHLQTNHCGFDKKKLCRPGFYECHEHCALPSPLGRDENLRKENLTLITKSSATPTL